MNRVSLTGYISADPEMRYTSGDKPRAVTNFTICARRPHAKEKVDFIPCVAWGKLAEIVGEHAKKGTLAEVEGYWTVETYKVEEQKRTKHQVTVGEFFMLGRSAKSGRSE